MLERRVEARATWSKSSLPDGATGCAARPRSQVWPWTATFSQELAAGSPFRGQAFVAGKDAVTLPADILALDQEQFGAGFRKSPVKRVTLTESGRSAAVCCRT